MKSVRLLPVVILAAAALLLFKGIGIVTNGGYVLTGSATAEAAGAGGGHGGSAGDDAIVSLPAEPTLGDTSPTLSDGAPTLPLRGAGAGHGNEAVASGEHGTDPAEDAGHGNAEPVACPPDGEASIGEHLADGTDAEASADDCAEAGLNAAGDILPTMMDGEGNIVPMEDTVAGSGEAVAERLGARREALDNREAELEMRMALVEAAEKRIAERTRALEVLEARINALVEEKKASEDRQFNSIVAMYETMKPKEAAAVFDQLEISVLVRVASAIPPRKMAQIMAKMTPQKARELTASMAVEQAEPNLDLAQEDLAALPQIVGQ